MDYPTAAFLAMIALTGLVSVIIYKVKPRQSRSPDIYLTHLLKTLHEDNNRIIQLLEALPEAIGSKVANEVTKCSYVGVQNTNIEHLPREKLSKKLLTTADWITTNDPDGKMSVRQVAQGAGVSIGTAQAAIKLVQNERSIGD